MVRACYDCKEYMPIDPADPNNQKLIKIFESNHKGHVVISLSLSEVEKKYKNVEKKIAEVSQPDVRIIFCQITRVHFHYKHMITVFLKLNIKTFLHEYLLVYRLRNKVLNVFLSYFLTNKI